MKLIDLSQEYAAILDEIEACGGEVTDTQELRLDAISRELVQAPDKADFVIKKLDCDSRFYGERIKELQGYKRAIDNAQSRFKDQIKDFMHTTNQTRLGGEYVDLVLKASKPKVVIDDESKVPDGYIETTIVRTPDKARMYEDMKMGVPVDGARLEDVFALQTTKRKSK